MADKCKEGVEVLENGTCGQQARVKCHARQIYDNEGNCKDCKLYTRSSLDRTRCVSVMCTPNEKLLESGNC